MDNDLFKPGSRVVLRKTSLVDYPLCISAVIFFPGCNLRCPWCHNRDLALGKCGEEDTVTLEEAEAHIKKRRRVLGGVVLSGGEPTLFKDLGLLITRIKLYGLKVKIDTNGLLPGVLQSLIEKEETRPDYIAMDLKTSPDRYAELLPKKKDKNTGAENPDSEKSGKTENPGKAVIQSAAIIRASGIAHEFRSLELPPLLTAPPLAAPQLAAPPPDNGQGADHTSMPFFGKADRMALAELAGDSPWHIRPFVPGNCIDPDWDNF